jgi:hypothetical protein
MRGKGHVVDPENIRPPAGSSILLKIGVVAHASSSRCLDDQAGLRD